MRGRIVYTMASGREHVEMRNLAPLSDVETLRSRVLDDLRAYGHLRLDSGVALLTRNVESVHVEVFPA